MSVPASKVLVLENVNRVEHFDQEGGGSIVRTLYCQPYSSHPTVLTALKGSVYNTGTYWNRIKPHADPIYNWFYVDDVKVVPMVPEAVTGMSPSGFNPTANDGNAAYNGQLTACQTALGNLDDINYSNIVDFAQNPPINDGTIAVGGAQFSAGDTPPGKCGAYITATYRPLLFVQGLSSFSGDPEDGNDPFDYVDPQWEPITKLVQLGRSFFTNAPDNPAGQVTAPVVRALASSDTATMPELIWRFSVRRIMVPFIPKLVLGAFANKLNKAAVALGNLTFPPGTMRFETPQTIQRRGPDGNTWFDIHLTFMVRMTWDTYFNYTGQVTAGPPDFLQGWVDWNHQLCIPVTRLMGSQVNTMMYWPISWYDGVFQIFGTERGMFLYDADVDMTLPGIANAAGIIGTLGAAPFTTGFRTGQ